MFLFNDPATTEIYTYCHTLSLHDALPICAERAAAADRAFVLPLEGLAVLAAAVADGQRGALRHDVQHEPVRETDGEAFVVAVGPDGAQAHALLVGAVLVIDGLAMRAAPERQAFETRRTVVVAGQCEVGDQIGGA